MKKLYIVAISFLTLLIFASIGSIVVQLQINNTAASIAALSPTEAQQIDILKKTVDDLIRSLDTLRVISDAVTVVLIGNKKSTTDNYVEFEQVDVFSRAETTIKLAFTGTSEVYYKGMEGLPILLVSKAERILGRVVPVARS